MRSITEVRDNGNDTMLIRFRDTKGNLSSEVFRIDDFALIDMIETAKQMAAQR